MACVIAIAPDGIAQAQVVERNLPPEPPRRASAIKIDTNDLLKSDDATPLGVNVQAIVLIGANTGAKPASGVKGVDVSQVSGIDAAALREQLTPFVDRPLSRKLIAEVQAAVAAAYREAGRPFVSVTLPPQEVSSGVLQLRVILFKVAGIKVTGAAPRATRQVASASSPDRKSMPANSRPISTGPTAIRFGRSKRCSVPARISA